MLDHLPETKLMLTFCGSDADKEALLEAGFRSVRKIDDHESIYVGTDVDPTLAIYSKFILAFRRDQFELRDAIAMVLDDSKCSWVAWPDEYSGAAECLKALGKPAFRDFLKTDIRPMWLDEVSLLRDIPEELPQEGFRTGFKGLDEHGFRLIRPAFMPVIGPYGSGKSVLLRQLAVNLYKLHGWRTLITAFEEKVRPRYERDLRRLFIDGDREMQFSCDTPEHRYTPDIIERADVEINKAFRFLRRKRGGEMDVQKLLDRIDFAVRVYGVEVVIIDPVNEIDHAVPRGMNKTDYMGQFIQGLKHIADDHRLLMIVAAHPPKDGVAKRQSKSVYTLNDGADTAHYGNKADIGWCVWRPSMQGATYLNIDKCKDTEVMGVPTFAKLGFDPGLGRFSVMATGEQVLAELLGESE